jgi:hypothetical protein
VCGGKDVFGGIVENHLGIHVQQLPIIDFAGMAAVFEVLKFGEWRECGNADTDGIGVEQVLPACGNHETAASCSSGRINV